MRNLQMQKLLIGSKVVGRCMYHVICYSYFVARLSIGNVLDAVSREVAHTPAGFGHVIQSLLEILIWRRPRRAGGTPQ